MRSASKTILMIATLFMCLSAYALPIKGIYLTQSTLENPELLNYLITRSKNAGINTFIVDIDIPSKNYKKRIAEIKQNNISYIARVVVFSSGGTADQVTNKALWEKRYKLVQYAIDAGADQIQLDYIRYNTSQKPSQQNAENVVKVIEWFKKKVAAQNIPLQVDVFGVASFKPELHIGQDLPLMAKTVDAICPMVYPSHYDPYVHHAERPYDTVFDSLQSLKAQFNNKINFKLYPYIELSNYRYPLSRQKKIEYIRAQLRAASDANADGFYAWSPHNKYDLLFEVLEPSKTKAQLTENTR